MDSLKKLFLFIVVVVMPNSQVAAAEENLVNFRIVCAEQKAECFKATVRDTKEDVYVENKPVLNLLDIDSAQVVKYELTEDQLKPIIAQGYKEEDYKIQYQISLKFRNSNILKEVTSENVKKRMAIFINNELVMAATIFEPIESDSMNISDGHFTAQSVQDLSDQINKAIALR